MCYYILRGTTYVFFFFYWCFIFFSLSCVPCLEKQAHQACVWTCRTVFKSSLFQPSRWPEGRHAYFSVLCVKRRYVLERLVNHIGLLVFFVFFFFFCDSYLTGVEPAQCAHLKIPMHCVVQLNPKGYGYEEWRCERLLLYDFFSL